jgi:hypothetical protein
MYQARQRKETGAVTGAFAPEIPNPRKSQNPKFQKIAPANSALMFGFWSLLGAWILGFGISRLANGS